MSAHALALASEIGQAGASRNTGRVREAALAYWRGCYAVRYRQALAIPPIGLPVPVITQSLVDHALVDARVLPAAAAPGAAAAPPAGCGAAKLGWARPWTASWSRPCEHRAAPVHHRTSTRRPKAASTRRSTTRPWGSGREAAAIEPAALLLPL